MYKITIDTGTIVESKEYDAQGDAYWSVAQWQNHYYWDATLSEDGSFFNVKIYHYDDKPKMGYSEYRVYRHQMTVKVLALP